MTWRFGAQMTRGSWGVINRNKQVRRKGVYTEGEDEQ